MKKTYELKSIRRNQAYDGGKLKYYITPIHSGLQSIKEMLDEYNKHLSSPVIKFELKSITSEERARIAFKGKRKFIVDFLNATICTDLLKYFTLNEIN